MGLSEVLAILGLMIAIVAFVSEQSREYLFLKFSKFDIGIVVISFLLIHVQISFDWLSSNWFPFLKKLTFEHAIRADVYAYFTTVLLLCYFCWVVFYRFFPKSNMEKVIKYYQKLIYKSEYTFVLSLVERFHYSDILEYLEKVQKIEYTNELWFIASQKYNEEYDKVIKTKRLKYAAWVFNQIVIDESLMDNTVNTRPYFFTDIVGKITAKGSTYRNFVQRFVRILMNNNNYHLFRELKNNDNQTEEDSFVIPEEHKIIHSFFKNIKVADENMLWQPIGEPAIDEMDTDKVSKLRNEYFDEDKSNLWDYKIYASMRLFDIMIREAIVQKPESHMWLFYFRTFSRKLIENIGSKEDYDINETTPSINHWLLYEVVSICRNWIEVAHKNEYLNIAIDSSKCLGEILLQISSAKNLSESQKVYLFDMCLHLYFRMSQWGDSTVEYREYLEQMFLKPSTTFGIDYSGYIQEKIDYVSIMKVTWSKFDLIKYSTVHGKSSSIEHFKLEVLEKLGIQD